MLRMPEKDHCYARHWSEYYLTNTGHVLPMTKILQLDEKYDASQNTNYFHKSKKRRHSGSDYETEEDSEEEIDVCGFEEDETHTIGSSSWHCVEQKARMQMNECERHVASANKLPGNTVGQDHESYWEDNVNKSHWSIMETKLFNRTLKILQSERLARLAYKGSPNEIVLRRLSVDRSAAKLHIALIDVEWNVKLAQWLHSVLLENLPASLLSYYLDIMQTLRSKVPTLIERMIMPARDSGSTSSERLGILLKRPWDPAVTAVVSTMKKKPSHSILFLVVQCSVTASAVIQSRRQRFWNSLLSQIGKVVQVTAPSQEQEGNDEKTSLSVEELHQKMFAAVCGKVRDLSSRHSNRKIVLVGWHTTSILNCHVALKEDVAALVCLGFPLYTIFGRRGAIDDVICDLTTPTIFITGDQASFCDVNDLEDAREKTFTDAVTSSLVVGGADDWLCVSASRRRKFFVTQCMIDRLILEGICDFLCTVLMSPEERDDEALRIIKNEEPTMFRKRPSSMNDLCALDAKRQRSSSPLLQRQSSTSAQINKILSNQKQTTGRGTDSKLQGLSFDLQTGSVSGLTSVPGSVNENRRALSTGSAVKTQKPPTPKWKTKAALSSSRSITIDLTKDPNAQLSSALSKQRKSQLLHPSESQTEAAVAAILAGDDESNESAISEIKTDTTTASAEKTSSRQTAIMSPSMPLGRYTPTSMNVPTTIAASDEKSSPAKSLSLTLGGSIGNLSASRARGADLTITSAGLKRVREGMGRFTGPDSSSLLASRSRKEDRETQQATAILEQLTSSIDAGKDPDSRSASPETISASRRIKSRFEGGQRRSSDVYPQAATLISHNCTSRVRTRGGSRSARANTLGVTRVSSKWQTNNTVSPKSPTRPVVKYVLTPSGLRGVVASRTGTGESPRQITLFPDRNTSKTTAIPTKKSSSSTALLLTVAPKKMGTSVPRTMSSHIVPVRQQTSSTPLTDLVLEAANSSRVDSRPSRISSEKRSLQSFGEALLAGTALPSLPKSSISKKLTKTEDGRSIISSAKASAILTNPKATIKLQQRTTALPSKTLQKIVKHPTQTTTVVSNGGKTVAKVVTAKGSERATVCITRPRSATSGTTPVQVAKVVSAANALSTVSANESNSSSVRNRMPSLILTKLTNESLSKAEPDKKDK